MAIPKKTINRIWNGLASLRDFVVKDLKTRGKGVQIFCKGEVMTLTQEQLESGKDTTGKTYISNINPNQKYNLIDWKWKPDIEPKSMELQNKLF